MKLFRIGDKVVSEDKIHDAIATILEAREAGATQEDVARANQVQRSFVSFLETLGEVRRGDRVALVGFPVANAPAVRALAEKHAVDFVLVLSQQEREKVESGDATIVFNSLLDTIAQLREYDTVVLLASDWRIKTMEKILGAEIVGVPLGASPLRHAVEVDLDELETILDGVMCARQDGPSTGRTGVAPRQAEKLTRRWNSSKK